MARVNDNGPISEDRLESHAEGQVDLTVYRRFFSQSAGGTCIEVGAARPDWLSIGALFRQAGWDVLSIEPNPHFAQLHRLAGHDVVECACGSSDQEGVSFFVVDCGGEDYQDGKVTFESWSSLGISGDFRDIQRDYAAEHPDMKTTTITVPVRRLDTLLAQHRPKWSGVDLIVVDVEGWELDVLNGLTFDKYRPKIVILENLFCHAEHRIALRKRGYVLWKRVQFNEIYARSDLIPTSERLYRGAINAAVTAGTRLRLVASRTRRHLLHRLRNRSDAAEKMQSK